MIVKRTDPFSIYEEEHWDIYDPYDAKTIATFFIKSRAEEYLEWLTTTVTEWSP